MAFNAELSQKLLMIGVLGSVVQRKGLTPSCRGFLSRGMIALFVSAAPFRGSLVINTSRLLRSAKVFRAALLFLEIRLSPSQWP